MREGQLEGNKINCLIFFVSADKEAEMLKRSLRGSPLSRREAVTGGRGHWCWRVASPTAASGRKEYKFGGGSVSWLPLAHKVGVQPTC